MIDIKDLFNCEISIEKNIIYKEKQPPSLSQRHTNDSFSYKWQNIDKKEGDLEALDYFQKKWYLDLYGFTSENVLRDYLRTKKIIFDAGCGLGYKTAWFAELSPESVVIGMDYSNAIFLAAKKYCNLNNLFFIKGDIADSGIKHGIIDYISCDQVIHHTDNPELTFEKLSDLLVKNGEFACYVYAKKAIPRELLDDYFREATLKYSNEEIQELSKQLTQLGKTLSELDLQIDVPDMPLLGIKGGLQDIQRFIYWNFIKCFWNKDFGEELSVSTNFDWYSPSNAKRYTEEEFRNLITLYNLKICHFHKEEACLSGRFKK